MLPRCIYTNVHVCKCVLIDKTNIDIRYDMFAHEELFVFTGLSCESIGTSAVYTLHLQFIEFVKSGRSI